MKSEKVAFKSPDGHKLTGILDMPVVGHPRAYALFAHCFTCSKDLKAVQNISRALTGHQLAVLRFDFTGLGHSEGDFSETNFSSTLADLQAAYDFLAESYQPPQLMIGHSLGGAAVLHLSGRLKEVKAVITIGAPANPQHVRHLIKGNEQQIRENGVAEVSIGGRPFKIKEQFLRDLEQADGAQVIRKLKKALLIMHSPQDQIVGIDQAAAIYEQAMHPKSFITLDGADHLMSNPSDSEYAGTVIGSWASRYMEPQPDEIAPEGEVWVRLSDEGFTTEIIAGRHRLIADEPKGSGGEDRGPSPYGYLLSALGTCTAMTLHMYADFKKLDLQEVRVKLTHDKIHVEDGSAKEESKGKIDRINRYIELKGNLSEAERKRLIEIADRCPVHKTLEGKPLIVTEEISE